MEQRSPGVTCSPGVALRVILPTEASIRFDVLYPGVNLDRLITSAIRVFADLIASEAFPKNQVHQVYVTCVPAPHERGKQFIVTVGSSKHVSAFVNRTPLVLKLRNCVISQIFEFMGDHPHGPDVDIVSSICVTVALEHFRLFHLTQQ